MDRVVGATAAPFRWQSRGAAALKKSWFALAVRKFISQSLVAVNGLPV
jgi:hypothetical protein